MLVVRTLGVVAMRKVRGRKEDVSGATAIPPDYEPLKNSGISEPVCLEGQYPPGKLWQSPRTRKASWYCVRGQSVTCMKSSLNMKRLDYGSDRAEIRTGSKRR
jgi:hypothetical protein